VSELVRTLGVLVEPPGPDHAGLWELVGLEPPSAADHTDLFVLQLYPYASVHLGEEGGLGGEARDRIAGFLRALGGTPPAEPDHLAVLLGAYATLLDREATETAEDASSSDPHPDAPATVTSDPLAAPWARARATLLVEHLLSWLPGYLDRVRDLGAPAYRSWADLLDEVLEREAGRTPTAAELLPAHLEDAPGLTDPRDGDVAAFLDGLLAPVRLGATLTASDLARAAEDLGLGRRVGERRFVLRALFDQDAAGLLGWLAAAARSVADTRGGAWHADTATGHWWRRRATESAALLSSLAADADAVEHTCAGAT
jgi:TorA maturation chaperone TorD